MDNIKKWIERIDNELELQKHYQFESVRMEFTRADLPFTREELRQKNIRQLEIIFSFYEKYQVQAG